MKRGWVFQAVPMRTPLKRSFKILQQILFVMSRYIISKEEVGNRPNEQGGG